MENTLSILELVPQLRTRDPRAWTEIVQLVGNDAFRTAFSVLRDSAAAEDVVQTALLKAYRSVHTFDPTRDFRAWFAAIVRNSALDAYRRRRRRAEIPGLMETLEKVLIEIDHKDESESDAQRERFWGMVEAVSRPSELKVMEAIHRGLSNAKIAEELDLAEGTVRGHVAQVLKKVRKLLKKSQR